MHILAQRLVGEIELGCTAVSQKLMVVQKVTKKHFDFNHNLTDVLQN